jgi:tripartite-type tricarboxylate transporter receptor subunit TctC
MRLPSQFARVAGVLFAALCVCAANAQAPSFPSRAVRIIVPYPAGGVVDAFVRRIAQDVATSLNNPVVVENRAGANTMIGLAACAKAPPDGHTLCASSGDGMSFNPWLYGKLPYNADTDFVPVSQLVWVPGIIVASPNAPFDTVGAMVDQARAKPATLNFASFGVGSTPHLFLEWFRRRGGVDIVHVPYKGAAETLPAVMAGEAHATFVAMGIALPLIKAGRMKAIAVTTPARLPQLPNVPTLAEQQLDPKIRNWFGVFAPAGTPAPIVQRLGAVFAKAVHDPAIQSSFLVPQGYQPVGTSPAEFATFLAADRAEAKAIVTLTGLQATMSVPNEVPR